MSFINRLWGARSPHQFSFRPRGDVWVSQGPLNLPSPHLKPSSGCPPGLAEWRTGRTPDDVTAVCRARSNTAFPASRHPTQVLRFPSRGRTVGCWNLGVEDSQASRTGRWHGVALCSAAARGGSLAP